MVFADHPRFAKRRWGNDLPLCPQILFDPQIRQLGTSRKGLGVELPFLLALSATRPSVCSMATLVPERREESTEYSSDLIDIEDDNPFLPHIPPPTAPPARPPLPPRDSPTGTDRRPSAPPSEILFSLEESDRALSDLYLDDIYPSNPFAESTSTSTEGQRQTRDTGGGSASAAYPTLRPSPSSGTNRSGGVETSSRNPRNPTSSSQVRECSQVQSPMNEQCGC